MSTSKKDCAAIAKAIMAQRGGGEIRQAPEVRVRLDALAEDLAAYFIDANPAFDRRQFLVACGAA